MHRTYTIIFSWGWRNTSHCTLLVHGANVVSNRIYGTIKGLNSLIYCAQNMLLVHGLFPLLSSVAKQYFLWQSITRHEPQVLKPS